MDCRVSGAAKMGKVTTIQEDSVIASSTTWWRLSKYCTKFDVHLCGKLACYLSFESVLKRSGQRSRRFS